MSEGVIVDIKKSLESNFEEFEKNFELNSKSNVPLLNTIMRYIIQRKGKQIRPLFVLLVAKLLGEINEKTYRGASLVELLHTATLVHDDVVDESWKRRGFFSVNALWKTKVAVLVGDYLLSKGLLLALDNDDFVQLKILSTAVRKMSEGELLQLEKARNFDITRETYYEIIDKKTASLIGACCGIGASTVLDNEDVTNKMIEFGSKVGLAFQIKDDLFDYGDNKIGKPTGLDIIERKLTLPLIHALEEASETDRNRIIHILKSKKRRKRKVSEVVAFVNNSNGIRAAQQKMEQLVAEAFKILDSIPNKNDDKHLRELVKFVISRKR